MAGATELAELVRELSQQKGIAAFVNGDFSRVVTCGYRKGGASLKLFTWLLTHRARKPYGRANLGLRSVVGRSAGKSPYSGRWALAATPPRYRDDTCLEGRRFLPGARPSPLD